MWWSLFICICTVQITFIFIDFRVCDFAFGFKTQNAPCVLNVFYFQTDFNLRFNANETFVWLVNARLMHLISHITHSNVYAPYIAYHRSNGFHQLFRKLKPKPKLNPPNAHRSHIKICVSNVPNVPNVPNAFRILKPIQKSSKRVWVFRNTGANAFAKNQMRLAYEDKRDLYCSTYKSHDLSVYFMTFDFWWPLKAKSRSHNVWVVC